ncbi:DUF2142 domain-containing protein [Leifsonia sp. fls2-241-R2A-40a]|uniref:DUF2142 domain-containing protein n=1 Tax=Leifsonia sp. fls2-241-R2A-40a TaxID=3040290 RepID=UPI0025519A78|nr:DUF2142 domain-containing protein [Leifsonia sp. fls2-241-R2A-40a]
MWRPLLVVWALLSALCACWSFATPISASPDEPAHIIRAASVVRGELIGTPSRDGHIVTVPAYIARTGQDTCFAFNQGVTADCTTRGPASTPPLADPDALTQAPTTAGLYNPIYYAVVGWPSLLFHDVGGVYAMRIMSGILTSLFAALGFSVLWTLRRRALTVLGFSLAMTPALLFLGGSVNPSAVEATGILALFAAMVAVVIDPRPALLPVRAAIVAVAGAFAVNARGLSPLWALIAIAVPLLLARVETLRDLLRRRPVWIAAAVVALATLFAFAWTLGSNSLHNAVDNPDSTPQHFPGIGVNPLSGFWITLLRTVEYAHGAIGLFGWLDTPAPPEVFFLWAGLIGALLLAAVCVLRGRRLAFALTLLGAFVLLPPVVQAAYITGGGIIWQGRYALPLFVCLCVGVAVALDQTIAPITWPVWMRRLTLVTAVGLAVAQFYAFENTMRRYSVGLTGSLKAFLLGTPPWSPPGGVLIWLLLEVLVLAGAAWLVIRATRLSASLTEVSTRPVAVTTP